MRDCRRISMCASMALHTVVRLPETSTMSPLAAPIFSRSSGPMRAKARATSLLSASATRSFNVASPAVVIAASPRAAAADLHHTVVAAHFRLLTRKTLRKLHFLVVFLVPAGGRESQQVAVDFDLNVFGADAGHFGDHQNVVFFFKHVHHRLAHLLHHGVARLRVLVDVAERLYARLVVAQSHLHGDAVNALHLLVLSEDLASLGQL